MIPPVKTAAEPAYSVLACSFFWGACSSNQRPLIIRKIIKLKRQLRACMLLKARDCCYDANDLKSATLIKSLLPPSNICDACSHLASSLERKPSHCHQRRRCWLVI